MDCIVKAWISTKRIGEFLALEEVEEPIQVVDNDYAVQIDGSFSWEEKTPIPTLNLNLKIPHGKLYIVVGTVGSGKTSLLAAISGEIKRTEGRHTPYHCS